MRAAAHRGRLVWVALLAFSCGAKTVGSGLPREAPLPSLTTRQMGVLCDWINASFGGYGSIDSCDGGGSRHADTNQQACMGGFGGAQSCPTLTVGALEDCINAVGGDMCRIITEPRCVALEGCPAGDGGAD